VADLARHQRTDGARHLCAADRSRRREASSSDWARDFCRSAVAERTKLQVAHITSCSHSRALSCVREPHRWLQNCTSMLFGRSFWHWVPGLGAFPGARDLRQIEDGSSIASVARKERQGQHALSRNARTTMYLSQRSCESGRRLGEGHGRENVRIPTSTCGNPAGLPRSWARTMAENQQVIVALWGRSRTAALPKRADVWPPTSSSDCHYHRIRWLCRDSKRVSPTCLIQLERNRYSVPRHFAKRPVSLRVYPLTSACIGR